MIMICHLTQSMRLIRVKNRSWASMLFLKHSGKGDSLPIQVLLKKDGPIVNETDVTYLEAISRDIEKIDGVKTVRTITRPTGEIIEDLYVDHQLGLMSEGLGDATGGLDEVKKGLTEVQGGLDQVTGMFSTGSAAEVNGAGLAQAAGGMGQLSAGVGASTKGLDEIGSGLGELSASLKEMSESDSVQCYRFVHPVRHAQQ